MSEAPTFGEHPDWDALKAEVARKIDYVAACWEKLDAPGAWRQKIRKDLLLPNLELLAAFCVAIDDAPDSYDEAACTYCDNPWTSACSSCEDFTCGACKCACDRDDGGMDDAVCREPNCPCPAPHPPVVHTDTAGSPPNSTQCGRCSGRGTVMAGGTDDSPEPWEIQCPECEGARR